MTYSIPDFLSRGREERTDYKKFPGNFREIRGCPAGNGFRKFDPKPAEICVRGKPEVVDPEENTALLELAVPEPVETVPKRRSARRSAKRQRA